MSTSDDYGTPITRPVPNYTMTNLKPNSEYHLRVRAICADDESDYVYATLKTDSLVKYKIIATAGPNGTITPSDTVMVIKDENQKFTFSPVSGYRVSDVKINGSSIGVRSDYTFSNVQADAAIHVDFSRHQDSTKIVSYGQNALLLFPNPVREELNIKLSATFESLDITNLLGQVIYTEKIDEQNIRINISNYRPGVYFIRMKGIQGVVTKKFIKE